MSSCKEKPCTRCTPLDIVELLSGWELELVDEEVALFEPVIDLAIDLGLVNTTQGQQGPMRYVVCKGQTTNVREMLTMT